LPNFNADPSDKDRGAPKTKDSKIDKVKTAIDVAVKTLQSIVNYQNVLGFESSYIKSAPPIGAPKATLIPHPPPAAIISRFDLSFCKDSAHKIGM